MIENSHFLCIKCATAQSKTARRTLYRWTSENGKLQAETVCCHKCGANKLVKSHALPPPQSEPRP